MAMMSVQAYLPKVGAPLLVHYFQEGWHKLQWIPLLRAASIDLQYTSIAETSGLPDVFGI